MLHTLRRIAFPLLCFGSLVPSVSQAQAPTLTFANHDATASLVTAYQAAVQNLLVINTIPYAREGKTSEYDQSGLLRGPATFIRAGGGYEQPWTRDASVNSWNAGSLLEPAVARNTLYSVLRRQPDGKLIVQKDNQWWDQVIWIGAAWHHYLVTGDKAFLQAAYQAAQDTLARDRQLHFNQERGLYEGPAFLNDGIAGYPAPPADATESRGSFVLAYPGADRIMVGSTNCLYVAAYAAAAQMGSALARPSAEIAPLQAAANTLAQRIREQLWLPDQGRFAYFMYPDGKLDVSQEGAGAAFALLFHVASPAQATSLLRSVHTDPYGLPDVYPAFPRFTAHPGRHNDIVWPPISGFWAVAAAQEGHTDAFATETEHLASLLTKNGGHFWEIYNAETGKPDGGWQVGHEWDSEPDQTWSATAFLNEVYSGLFGMQFAPDRLLFLPSLPSAWGDVSLTNLPYRQMMLTVELHGSGNHVSKAELDGVAESQAAVPASLHGHHLLRIDLH